MSSKEVLFEVSTSGTTDPTFRVVRSETGTIETHYDCTYPTREPSSIGVTAIKDAGGNVVKMSAGGSRIGSVCLLHYENEGGFIALPESDEQIVSDVMLIPAGTLRPGDKLQFVHFSEDAGTSSAAARTVRLRIHTAADVMSGVALSAIQVSAGNNSKLAIDKSIGIVSNTKAKSSSSGQPGSVISTAAFSDATIDCTVDQYIGFTIQNANTLVNHLIYYANITLEAAQ